MGNNRIFVHVASVLVSLCLYQHMTNASIIEETQKQWPKPFGSPCRREDFRVFWAEPLEPCASSGYDFANLTEKFGIIQNHGDNEELRLIQFEDGLYEYQNQLNDIPANFSGYGLLGVDNCFWPSFYPHLVNILAEFRKQRPNGIWSLTSMPCQTMGNDNLTALAEMEDVVSPGIYNEYTGALNDAVKYLDNWKKIILEDNITTRIIPNFWMQLHNDPEVENGVGYDYLKAFVDRGFCEVAIMPVTTWAELLSFRFPEKCAMFDEIVHNTLGPAVVRIREELAEAEMRTNIPIVPREPVAESDSEYRVPRLIASSME